MNARPLVPSRRRLITGAVALACGIGSAPIQAQTGPYPNRPIRLVVPFPPGGSVDPLAREIGTRLTETMGQQVIVDNRAGGSSTIGADFVAKQPGDGYTLLMTATSHMTTAQLMPVTYDPIKDFTPVASVTNIDFVLIVNNDLPAKNLQELIALAKAKPGTLNYGSAGIGNPNHLLGEFFDMTAGVKTKHIPYKGAAAVVTDMIGGLVQMHYGTPITVLPFIKSGRVRAIAVSGKSRLASLPDVPTFAESGLRGFEFSVWYGILGPKGMPRDVVERLRTEIRKALALPTIKQKFEAGGFEIYDTTLEKFEAEMKSDQAKFARIIKDANVKME